MTCSSCAAIGICTSHAYPLYALHGNVPSPFVGICSVRHRLVQRFSAFPPLKPLGWIPSSSQFSSPFSFLSATSYLFDPIHMYSMLLCFICTCCSVPYFSSIPLLCRCSDHGLHFRCFMLLTTFPILQGTIGTTFFYHSILGSVVCMSPFMRVAVLYPSCVLPCFTYDITYA
jgi:hypothetical protein